MERSGRKVWAWERGEGAAEPDAAGAERGEGVEVITAIDGV